MHTCNPSNWATEAGGSGVPGLSWLQSQFEASVNTQRMCLYQDTSMKGVRDSKDNLQEAPDG